MAAFNKINAFVENLAEKVHNLQTDTLKVVLSNTAPSAANNVLADIVQIAAGNGHPAGGLAANVVSSQQAGGVYRLILDDVIFTAVGGNIGPFRYAILYNDTPTAPADPLIGWYDRGSAVTIANGDSYIVDFDGTNGVFTLT